MNPLWIAAAVGIALALALNSVMAGSGTGSLFTIQGKTRFWAASQVGKLQQVLGASIATPHAQVGGVWVLTAGSGGLNALALVRKIQKSGNVATTTTNLYDVKDTRMMAEVLGADLLALDTSTPVGQGVSQAVLPVV